MEVKTFILENPDNLDKISCHSHDPEFLKLISKLSEKGIRLNDLSTKISYSSGKWELTNKDYVPQEFPNSIRLLKITNIKDGEIVETEKDDFIQKYLHEKWKVSQIIKNDLILSIAGTMGKVALFNKDYPANLNSNLAFMRLKEQYKGIKIIPEFIHFYLNSYFAFEQFMALGGYRSGQSGLSLDEIGSVYVILPEEKEQRRILNKMQEIKDNISKETAKKEEYLHKLNNLLDDYTELNLSNIGQTWVVESDKIFDRIDCYFNSQELEKIRNTIEKLDKSKFEIIKAKNLNLISAMKKEELEENKIHVFKYVDIGNTEKELGEIQGYQEDILFNLPSRAKMKAEENDVLIPKLIGSTQGIVKVNHEFNNQIFTTGNIQIRPTNEDEAFLLWTMLKSDTIQKQFFYLQSGCSQLEISPNNFEEYVLLPFPKGKIKEEIINKSKEYYKETLKHKNEILNLQKEMIKEFNSELKKYL